MSKPSFNRFEIPSGILDKLYEVSGGPESYKGFIIAYSTEKGEPVIHTKCDTRLTEYGLKGALESYLTSGAEEAFEVEDSENT